MELVREELERSADNLGKIGKWLAERVSWSYDGPRETLERLQKAADGVGATALSLLRSDRSTAPPELPERPDPLAPEALPPDRLERMAAFAVDLERWLDARKTWSVPADALLALRRISGSTMIVVGVADSLLQRANPEPEPRSETQPSPHQEMPTRPQADPDPETVGSRSTDCRPLVLVDDNETSLVSRPAGRPPELGATAAIMLGEFLDDHGIEMSRADRRRFDDKLVRWIEATPEGQALVLKVGGLRGQVEPYPSYVPRETVLPDDEDT